MSYRLMSPSSSGVTRPISETARRLEHQRLVTLWGPGGVGKTRLAVRVRRVGAIADSAKECASSISQHSLIPLPYQTRSLLRCVHSRWVASVRSTPSFERSVRAAVLMVLDNCEQVLEGVRLSVDAILRRCAGTWILTTSREPLGRSGESTLEIRPLTVPH